MVPSAGADEIELTDVITNPGYERVPISMLYHFNIGYPLLSETAEIVIPAIKTDPRDEHAKKGLDECTRCCRTERMGRDVRYYSHTLSEKHVRHRQPHPVSFSTRMRISAESDPGCSTELVQWRQLGEETMYPGTGASLVHA